MTTAGLDAATLACCRDLAGRLFPWDTNRALELALRRPLAAGLRDLLEPVVQRLWRPRLEQLNRPRWSGPQRRIGLTGGIASGKSTVARWLAEQGLPVLDADVYAREALAAGSAGAATVLERYGEAVRAPNSDPAAAVIDRAALGQIVFEQPQERRWLEQLVHPLVRARFEAELAALAEAPAAVLVIPLLFEVGLDALCSEVWLVDCDPEQQLQRLMQRDGLSEAAAQARIAAQWPLERKRGLADRIVDNRGVRQSLNSQLPPLLQWASATRD